MLSDLGFFFKKMPFLVAFSVDGHFPIFLRKLSLSVPISTLIEEANKGLGRAGAQW